MGQELTFDKGAVSSKGQRAQALGVFTQRLAAFLAAAFPLGGDRCVLGLHLALPAMTPTP